MITFQVDGDQLNQAFQDELQKKMDKLEHAHTFWDTKELKRRTCMSWNTIQDNFFHHNDFPKAKVGGKWYFPAEATNKFLIKWLQGQAS
ncbi:group-specific protein [Sporosarcina sp. resist]|uniref:group-specific protein n=1 Tax=Sporosarcina sp. resist TaxID=2762563 RepID=UPI00164E92E3|nr:group-specific protein [Sporosarcina sp. resist]QNK89060.1 group-specific protein [Sporosarcina sp. resist]